MIRNYFKIAFRSLKRNYIFSLINITGLTIGIACALIIYLYVNDELSYDKFNRDADRKYRVLFNFKGTEFQLNTSAPIAPALKEKLPEIESAARVFTHWFTPFISYEDKGFMEEKFFFTDSNLFSFFSFELVNGNDEEVLKKPLSVVISESAAHKYFGNQNPVGKKILYNSKYYFTITGIMKDSPHNSHFRPQFAASINSLPVVMWPNVLEMQGLSAFKTYIHLKKNTSIEDFRAKLKTFISKNFSNTGNSSLDLQPLTDIHLYSQFDGDFEANNDIKFIYILSAIGFIIILIAAFNYVNITTAASLGRGKEISIRKVIGARRKDIAFQFLGESIITSLISLAAAIAVVEIFLPYINQLTGKEFSLNIIAEFSLAGGLILLCVLFGLLAGYYPSLVLSKFNPVKSLKGNFTSAGSRTSSLRKSLVVVQFAASIILITASMVIYSQLNYISSKSLGFEKEQVIAAPIKDDAIFSKYDSFKNEISRLPGVSSAAGTNSYPGKPLASSDVSWEGGSTDEFKIMNVNWIDDNLINTLGIKLIAGRNFLKGFSADLTESIIVNEAAVKSIGWNSPEDAIGRIISSNMDTGRRKIIGVIKDYHMQSLHHRIEPLILYPQELLAYILIRLNTEDIQSTLSSIKDKWKEFASTQPFSYTFLDEDFSRLYQKDVSWGKAAGAASAVAVFIACLGLSGLSLLSVQKRTKEIGVRKIMGASSVNIIALVINEFSKLIFAAFIIASPLAYYAANKWLEKFAYHTEITLGIFLAAGSIVLLIAAATISIQALKASLINPVKSLKDE